MGKSLALDSVREAELERMMNAYGGMLTGLCSALVKDSHLAQDIVQETFVKAWRKMDSLRGGRQSEKAWLCRIALNLCRDCQRTRWLRLVEPKAEIDQPAPWYTIENDSAADVMEALGALKPKYREVLTLHYLQNMNAEEIGQIVNLSPSAVYRRLSKAKSQFRRLLEGWENDG